MEFISDTSIISKDDDDGVACLNKSTDRNPVQ